MKHKKHPFLSASLAIAVSISFVPESFCLNSTAAAQAENGAALSLITEKPPCIFGDMNGDSHLSAADLTLLKKNLLNGAAYDSQADLNGDGDVNAADAAELRDFLLTETHALSVYCKYDTDDDSLSDYAEIVFGLSDPGKADTDGDGLSDYEELCIIGSDPKQKDSEEECRAIAQSDEDEDGLTNAEEAALGSNPYKKDTDGDGLDDGYEAGTLKSSPVMADTDGDGLNDFEEEQLGLNPLNPNSDGTPDSDRMITQVISADDPLLADINTEDNAYVLSADIEASGYAPHCLSVRESKYSYAMKDGSAVGITPEFIYAPEFNVGKITLHFEIKEAFRDNVLSCFSMLPGEEYEIDEELDGVKRFYIFKYIEGINTAVPVYTECDPDTASVSVTLDSFEQDDSGNSYGIGSYALVDLEVWGNSMSEPAETVSETDTKPAQPKYSPANIFTKIIKKKVKDVTETVKAVIYKNYERRKEKEQQDSASVISGPFGRIYARYDISGMTWTEAEAYCEKMGGHLAVITSEAEEKTIENLTAQGALNSYWLGGQMQGDQLFWITGERSYYANFAINQPDHINEENYLMIYRLDNPVITRESTKLKWNNIRENGTYPNETFFGAKNFGFICEWESGHPVETAVNEICSIMIGGGSTILNGNLDANSGNDSDGDGIPDWDEVDHKSITTLGGSENDSKVTFQKAVEYGQKAISAPKEFADAVQEKISHAIHGQTKDITPVLSDPTKEDTDNDGYSDASDPDRLTPPEYLDGKYDFLNGEVYALKPDVIPTSLRLHYTNNGADVSVRQEDGSDCQQFKFVWDYKGYKIVSLDEQNALTVVASSSGGYVIMMQAYRGIQEQKWEVLPYRDPGTGFTGIVLRSRFLSADGKSLYLSYKGSKITAVTSVDRYCVLNLEHHENWYRFGELYMQQIGWIPRSVDADKLSRAFSNYRYNLGVNFISDQNYTRDPDINSVTLLIGQNGWSFQNMRYADAPMDEVICEVLGTYNAICMAARTNKAADFFRIAVEFEISGIRTNLLSGIITDKEADMLYVTGQAVLEEVKYRLIKTVFIATPYQKDTNYDHLTSSFASSGGWGSWPQLIGNCLKAYRVDYKVYDNKNDYDQALQDPSAKCGVLSESFGVGGFALHTFAVKYYNGKVFAFNWNCNINTASELDSVPKLYEKSDYYYGYVIY